MKDRDKIIASIRQEARGCELKLEAEISKLQRRLSGEAKSDDTEQKLRDHLKEQSKAIFDLRQILDVCIEVARVYVHVFLPQDYGVNLQ